MVATVVEESRNVEREDFVVRLNLLIIQHNTTRVDMIENEPPEFSEFYNMGTNLHNLHNKYQTHLKRSNNVGLA